ncbi:ABC transporter substrate-binding protein [Paralcaligenes sp. KSB-10]|uniref:ABC transporter substrate-binding protein n=1 Tax=Paralcaligenes sp. KSB-10 TaxID=2901142 RepID=UPI001E3694B9|nr:ABC transporter substrate-binding protein [Paralcaligenes sp. KSB-10]UHL66428.1 ABC transporter substrate-binding protein [Paralcaligenes sp. KSB-10]
MNLKWNPAACVALAAALIAGSAVAAPERTKVTIAIGTSVIDASQANNTSVPIYTGCWQREGLDVTIQPTNSSSAMQAVLSGQAQFVNMGPGAAILARAKGAPIKAVYLNMRRNFQFPVVLASSSIKSIQDFKGKTIGVISYGAQLVEIIKGMLAEAGLDPNKDVTFVETGAGAQAIAALTSGRVDVWGTWDSQIATAENMGIKLRRFTTPEAEKLVFGGSYFVRDDYVKSHPEVIEKVLRCVAEGSALVLANPEGAVKAHWKVYPSSKPTNLSDAEAMKQALNLIKVRSEFLRLEPGMRWGEFPPKAAKVMVDFMRANKRLKGELDPETLYTNQFVPAINKFDPQSIQQQAASLGK